MKILLHCDFDQQTIADHFGLSEYSYWFVFETYHAVLKEIFDTEVIADPTQADPLWEACDAAGIPCVLLSFNPPHKTPLGLSCPVIPVFAWEFPNIPHGGDERSWANDPRYDWEYVFRRVHAAITLSSHTVRAVTAQLGDDYPIAAIPAPLWDRLEPIRQSAAWRPFGRGQVLRLKASVLDCSTLGLSLEDYVAPDQDDGTPQDAGDELLLPPNLFARSEEWNQPMIPRVEAEPLQRAPGEVAPSNAGWSIPPIQSTATRLRGVVYTSVFTGSDARKNWPDMLTAFIWAFRSTEDAVLILKMGGAELIWQHQQVLDLLTRLSPFKCRVMVVYGYLDVQDYGNLIGATDFYVNTSHCEGLCMPLMEYLSCGVPAIAPSHTAMADYINADNCLVLESREGNPTTWPHGDRLIDRTSHPRIRWMSLMDSFRLSYQLIRQHRQDYARMSANAVSSMRQYCGDDAVKTHLQDFLSRLHATSRKRAENPDYQTGHGGNANSRP